jgi:hypothetical protein
MAEVRVLLVSEGKHELADCPDGYVPDEALPPLAILVRRLTGTEGTIRFCCRRGKSIRNMHHGKMSSGWGKKVYSAIWHAANSKDGQTFDAVVVLVDRDGAKNDRRLSDMQQGRNEYGESQLPCALGVAVETFDAWMIADPHGIAAANGDAEKAHAKPEETRLPKDVADAIFGTSGGTGLGPVYAVVAENANLANLEKACPRGFKPFADEVRRRIAPAIGGRG